MRPGGRILLSLPQEPRSPVGAARPLLEATARKSGSSTTIYNFGAGRWIKLSNPLQEIRETPWPGMGAWEPGDDWVT